MSDVQLVTLDSDSLQVILQAPGVQGPPGAVDFFDVSGTSYTLSEANRSKIGRFTNSSAISLTVPAGLSANFDCMILQLGTGQITFNAGVGVTLRSGTSAFKTAYRYAAVSIICIGTDEFLISGEVIV